MCAALTTLNRLPDCVLPTPNQTLYPGVWRCAVLHCVICCPQFKDWFSNPLTGAVETGQEVSRQLVERLHGVLRPFLLRCAPDKGVCVESVGVGLGPHCAAQCEAEQISNDI